MLQEYVSNTHAVTHSQYSLEVLEVFKVGREGEGKKYKPSQSSTTDSCSGTAPGRPTLWEYYLRYVVVLLCMHAQYLVSV